MAVKLLDLQLIYGVAGAREKFEELVTKLIKAEVPDSDGVRTKQGDGGLDIRFGSYEDRDGIEVWQCKFFPNGIGDAQKNQIRESYQRCRDSTEYKTKKWTLCLPADLSIDEMKWFDDWRRKQKDGIDICDPWGASKLEFLLYQSKNRGLMEAFFKQEYLTQIRQTHSMVEVLARDVATRLFADEKDREARRTAAQEEMTIQYVGQFQEEMRASFRELTKPPSIRLSQLPQAKSVRDDERAAQIVEASRRPGHWEILIHPRRISVANTFDTLAEGWSIAEQRCIPYSTRHFPSIMYGLRSSGNDWIGWTYNRNHEVESWRLSQRGAFVWMEALWNDLQPSVGRVALEGSRTASQRNLDPDDVVRVITRAHRFAARLADPSVIPDTDPIEITIVLTSTANRRLHSTNPSRLRGDFVATAAYLQNKWSWERTELIDAPDRLAAKASVWFLERFNLPVAEAQIARLQEREFPRFEP